RSTLRRDLGERLALEIDSALKRELESRFLEQVQRIDILREPRRWLSATFTWIKSWVTGEEKSGSSEPESTSAWLTRLYRDRYEEFVLRLAEDLREAAGSARGGSTPGVRWIETEPPSRKAIEDRLRGVFEELEKKIAVESERIADGLSTGGKVSFYSTQVIFHTLVSVACVKTGGLLTPAEVAAQGLVSPFVARLVAQFVSSNEATAVETRLSETFTASLESVTTPLLVPVENQLERFDALVPSSQAWQRAVADWSREGVR
ncbi:MAG: hypothetical protein KDC38_16695, partial [Planctomycetes bacterium]|nr:hypothetical protein [Planctomycetota bacterium]